MCKIIEFVAPEPSKSFKNDSGASGKLQKKLRSLRILGKWAPEPQNIRKAKPKIPKNPKESEAALSRIGPRCPDICRYIWVSQKTSVDQPRNEGGLPAPPSWTLPKPSWTSPNLYFLHLLCLIRVVLDDCGSGWMDRCVFLINYLILKSDISEIVGISRDIRK